MRIKDFVKCNLNNLFYREYRLRRKVRRHLLPYYKEAFPVGKNTNKTIVLWPMEGKVMEDWPIGYGESFRRMNIA